MPVQMLQELAQGWDVTLETIGDIWRLTLVNRNTNSRFTYRGTLARVVQAAWAGEPSGTW